LIIDLQLKPEKLRLAVGTGPLILDVIAVMVAPVCIAETELEVEFAVAVALADEVAPPFFPPLFPPVCDELGEGSVLVVVGCASRPCRWIAHLFAAARFIQMQSNNKTRIFDRMADTIVTLECFHYTRRD
jgi:hypothetical protein